MKPLVLGRRERAQEVDLLRAGSLSFATANGLKPATRVLIEALPKKLAGRILTALDSEAAVALAAEALYPDATITHCELDLHVAKQAMSSVKGNGAERVVVAAGADLPGITWMDEPGPDATFTGEPQSAVLMALPGTTDALFAREMLEAAHLVLESNGLLVTATDNVRGTWLLDTVKDVFGNGEVPLRDKQHGVAITARRRRPSARLKDRRHTYGVSTGEQSITITTRPGTFSHGHIDQGTKALLERAPLAAGQHVLDIGCGCGGLGLYAARVVAPDGRAVLVDSSCRATALAEYNRRANDIANASVMASATHDVLEPDHFDLVLANPPYFSNYRIAKLFALTARQVLKVGGQLAMVAKERFKHAEIVESFFGNCKISEHRGYGILIATRQR